MIDLVLELEGARVLSRRGRECPKNRRVRVCGSESFDPHLFELLRKTETRAGVEQTERGADLT
jgi:hypothetical protein